MRLAIQVTETPTDLGERALASEIGDEVRLTITGVHHEMSDEGWTTTWVTALT